jgi:hypothetical protein
VSGSPCPFRCPGCGVPYTPATRQWGRKSRGKCKPRAHKGKRCKTYKPAGSFNVSGVAGRNEKIFSGKIGALTLRPASYWMTLKATDAAGDKSKPSALSFAIIK